MFIAALVLIGGISLYSMKKATFPLMESHNITITVSYPGATPKEMEEGVTTLVENAIRGLAGIKEFSSESRENISSINVTALSNYDIDELLYEIKNAVDAISNFPAAAEKPIVIKQRRTDMAAFLSVHGENDDLLALNKAVKRIEDDFLATGIITQINILGLPQKMEISVELNETTLQRYQITMEEIKNAIAANNNDIHGGTIKNEREELLVLSRQRSVNPEDIENIVVKSDQHGNNILVKDLATVTLQFEETPGASYVNGKRDALIFLSKLSNEDLEEISDYINDYIVDYNSKNNGYQIDIMFDFHNLVNNQLNLLIENGLLGVILVIIMLSLLLNVRLSFWVAWGIPASFLGMFVVAVLSGVTLNMISLFGMILIIGILVDDGVVIGENIFTHHEMGKSPRRAAIDGTMEVLPAVLTSVTTTIIAFLPLFFIEGGLEMMYEMAFVVVVTLIFSLVEAMFVLPGHLVSSNALKPIKKKSFYGKIRKGTDKLIFGLRDKIYAPFVNWSLKRKFASFTIGISLFVITGGMLLGGVIPFTFFPPAPADMFMIDMALKPGTNQDLTLEKLNYIEKTVWEVNEQIQEEQGDTISYVKVTQVTIGSAFSGGESGTHAGMVRVFLNKIDETNVTEDIIKQRISKKLGKIPEAYKLGVGASNRFGAPVSISLMGYDLDQLNAAKNDLISELEQMTSLYNIVDNSQLGSQEIRLTLKPEAYSLGLNQQTLMNQVRNAYYGSLAQRMQEGKEEIWIYVRYPLENRETIGELEQMQIRTAKGTFPLSQIANLEFERSLNKINRYNGRREIRVEAYMKDQEESVLPIISAVDEEIMPMILEKYPDIDYMHQGQQKDTNEEMGSMITYFGIAFLIIVFIIMLYFKSARQGILVLMMIPFGVLGAIWGHGIHGETFSLMSMWGLVAMSGTIINDAIVFMSKYNQNIVKGMTVAKASFEAGKARFRAIFLTTVTTTAGLMPLILEGSSDARMLIPMAISLAYGILFGTFFILILLPHFIQLSNRLHLNWVRLVKRQNPKPEDIEVALVNHRIDQMLKKNMAIEFENGTSEHA
jgi:multidrug efflux pump subunit AcrB